MRRKRESLTQNAKYTSPLVQNEIISIGSDLVIEQISAELQKALCFAIIADESKDISKTEQLSIVVRYYLDGTIYERFLGFVAAKNLNASVLFEYIKKQLEKFSIDVNECVAQTYDGANVMSDNLNGEQKLFKNLVPQAL